MVFMTTEKFFMSDQIVTKLSKTKYNIGEIAFPSVTVCPDVSVPENFSSIVDTLSLNASVEEYGKSFVELVLLSVRLC
jgi:hypothetical protein